MGERLFGNDNNKSKFNSRIKYVQVEFGECLIPSSTEYFIFATYKPIKKPNSFILHISKHQNTS